MRFLFILSLLRREIFQIYRNLFYSVRFFLVVFIGFDESAVLPADALAIIAEALCTAGAADQ